MTRYTPPSIESYGGIEPYLEATRADHNGYGADDLKKNWRWGKDKHMNVSALALLFGVSWPTMNDWLDRLHAENSVLRPGRGVANPDDMPDTAK